MFALEDVAREVGQNILNYKGPVEDTKHIRGHEESSIDLFAYTTMIGSLEKHLASFTKEDRFKGEYLFELHELQDLVSEKERGSVLRVLRIDEIDGTTNTKRQIASLFDYNPNSAVSIALCQDESMGSIEVGVIYDLHNNNTFSAMHVDDSYVSFCDRKILNPNDFEEKKGEIEQAILAADPTKKDFRIYDGCRSTAIDIISILRNQFDAYIDPRALWKGSGAMLYQYDIAGVIPIAYGCGLEISDIYGNPIDSYSGRNEPLSIIIARKGLKERFVEALKPIAGGKNGN